MPSARRRCLARRIQREMVGGGAHEGRPLAGHGRRLRRPSAHRPATRRAACRVRRSSAKSRPTRLRLEEGVATLDQITEFVRAAIPDATPEEVCGLIDRGSGEPPRYVLDARPDRRHQGFLAARAICGCAGARSRRQGRTRRAWAARSLQTAARSSSPLRGKGTWSQPLDGDGDWQRLKRLDRAATATTPAFCARSKRRTRTSMKSANSRRSLASTAPPVGMDSQAKYAVLAAGEGDVLAAAALAVAARLPRKDLGPGGRLDRDRRSGRPNHRPRRQAARFLARPHARQKPRHPGHERPSARRRSRRLASNRRLTPLAALRHESPIAVEPQ